MLANFRKTPLVCIRNGVFGYRARFMSGGQFHENDLETINMNFRRSDKNIDHVLDMWEFNNFTKFTLGRRLNEVDLAQLFKLIDQDNDGQLSKSDVIGHLEKRFQTQGTGDMMYAFCTYDKNDDGYLSLHEVRQALYFLGFPGGHKQVKKVFLKYDTDNDSRINYKEFEKIVKEEMHMLL